MRERGVLMGARENRAIIRVEKAFIREVYIEPGVAVIKPAAALMCVAVVFGNIGLDVHKRCGIEDVYIRDVQHVAAYTEQPHGRHPQRVRPRRRACRKYPVGGLIAVGYHRELGTAGSMTPVQQPDALKTFQVTQPFGVLRKDLECRLYTGSETRLNRSPRCGPVRRVNDADRDKFHGHLTSPRRAAARETICR